MRRTRFFLTSKLLPPRAASNLLDRPRLVDKLEKNLNSPLTMIAADAGCGKTTLVASFLRASARPNVWYQLDHTDADPAVFLGYLTEGLQNIVADLGGAVFEYLDEAAEELYKFPERGIDLLLNEIFSTVEEPLIIVLDDYHHIGRETVVHKMVDRLLQYAGDLVHVIITTRDIPPLAITRRKTHGSALVIRREDLLFTDDEVRELFRSSLGVEPSADEIAAYRSRTHGWITALQLVRQIVEQEIGVSGDGGGRPDLAEILARSERDIFDYFVEEVFNRETPEMQRMLRELSILDDLRLDDCSRLFPDLRCSKLLPTLAKKNIFLTATGDAERAEAYRFHPLFRDFLLRRQRSEIGLEELNAQRSRVGEYFLEAGQWEGGLDHLIAGEHFDRASAVIAERGPSMMADGAFVSVGSLADRLPEKALAAHPRSLLYAAEAARLEGDRTKATARLSVASQLLNKNGDKDGEAEALHSLASLARRQRNTRSAYSLLERAEELASEGSEAALKCANTRGLCLIMDGEWAEAEAAFRYALELAEKQGNEKYIRLITHNLALAPGFRGDFGEALRWFKRIFRQGDSGRQLPQEAIGHLNVGRLHIYRGEFTDAEPHLERAMELCHLYNLRSLLGEIVEAYGNLYRERGDMKAAGEYYERALKAYEDAGVDITTRELDEERALYDLRLGNTAHARKLLEALIDGRRASGNESGVMTARALLARVSLEEGRTDGLAEEFDEVIEHFKKHSHLYDETLASFWLAETHFALGNSKAAVDLLLRVLDLAARYDYDHWLRGEMRRAPALFRQEDIFDRLPDDLKKELITPPATDPAREDAAATVKPIATADLTINILGPVDIFRDRSRPFAADAWTTRRARDIFCFIAAGKNHRAGKDVIIDTFWPDEDLAAVEKNFHPTISHIRKALNSRQAFKQNFLLFRDGAYGLDPSLTYQLDIADFEQAIADAEAAKRDKANDELRTRLERARSLYRGEFMEGVYDGWVEEKRQYFAEQFMRVLAAAAKLDVAEKKYSSALQTAGEVLAIDPYREDVHRTIMKIYAAQGKSAAVKDQYETLCETLKRELGIQPASETRRVYAELMK